MYPCPSKLRVVSRRIAIEVVREAKRLGLGRRLADLGLGRRLADDEIEAAVDRNIWYPDYASTDSSVVVPSGSSQRSA